MDIKETISLNGNITVKDANNSDVVAAYLSASINSDNMNSNITANITNKALLSAEGAANVAGETPAQQYTDFETAVKNKAKDLGFSIFA